MSKLVQTNGDDHPEAARKHLEDARTLERAARPDGAAYLAGYVVECCLKTLLLVESGKAWGHNLGSLASEASRLSSFAGAKTAKYVSTPAVQQLSRSLVAAWDPEQRYRAPGYITFASAATWVGEAETVYNSTIVPMILDGVL